MKRMKWTVWVFFILLGGCLTHYDAPTTQREKNVLVVNASINSSDQVATVILSRTIALSSATTSPAETGATVTILSDHNEIFRLIPQQRGTYSITKINFDFARKYQLKISTKDGKSYSSDFISLYKTPEIDSLTWSPSLDGITINGTTHDQAGLSRNYLWDFNETWEYTAPFQSALEYKNNQIIYRPAEDAIYVCWRTLPASNLLITSTNGLANDVVNKFALKFISKGSPLIQRRYSIEAKLRTINPGEYSYWSQVKKTTESFGGLFDPLPSQVIGNIHNDLDGTEPIIGYFGGGSVSKLRIFINESQLPSYLETPTPRGICEVDSVKVSNIGGYLNNYLIVDYYGGLFIIGYVFTTTDCADCRKGGGTLTKPDFWK